jgi:hypothetical protein
MRSRIHNSSVSTSEITSRGRRGVYSCVRFAADERAACALHEVHRPHHTTDNTTTRSLGRSTSTIACGGCSASRRRTKTRDRTRAESRAICARGRQLVPRPLTRLLALHISDLGGEDNVSEAERALLRRAVTLIIKLERREVMFAQAGAADDEALAIIVHPRSGG